MSTVFIVNKGCHDYSAAREFGELVYLSDTSMDRFDLSKIWRQFEPLLQSAGPDDFLLPSGLTNMTVVAASIFVTKHKRLNLLLFKSNKKGGKYIPETIILGEPHEGNSQSNCLGSARSDLRKSLVKNMERR